VLEHLAEPAAALQEPAAASCGAREPSRPWKVIRLVVLLPADTEILTRSPVPRGRASPAGRRFADSPPT
jgi:hypothetical protein